MDRSCLEIGQYWTIKNTDGREKKFQIIVFAKNMLTDKIKRKEYRREVPLKKMTWCSDIKDDYVMATIDGKYAYLDLKNGRAYIFVDAGELSPIKDGIGKVGFWGKHHFFDIENGQLDRIGYDVALVENRNLRIVGNGKSWRVILCGVSPTKTTIELNKKIFSSYNEALKSGLEAIKGAKNQTETAGCQILDVDFKR